jgi:hypothetical protein
VRLGRRPPWAAGCALLALGAGNAAAQSPPDRVTRAAPLPSFLSDTAAGGRPVVLGSVADDDRRLTDLFTPQPDAGLLLRSVSASLDRTRPLRAAAGRPAPMQIRVFLPTLAVAANSALPYGGNDASLWAGRGLSAMVRGGVSLQQGGLRLVLLPELAVAQNRAFAFFPSPLAVRSPYSSPWYVVDERSADLPTRLGARSWTQLGLGQSSATLELRGTTVGFGTENEWWGPGVRNAIALSNNAEGFPHFFVRPARPRRTRLGTVDARFLAGVLVPSAFFDTAGAREYRSFSGAAVTLSPARVPNLTIGLERTVVDATGLEQAGFVAHALNALSVWQPDGRPDGRGDQLTGVFARYRRPDDRVEVYGEWVSNQTPRNLRTFLLDPGSTQGFTVGLQAARPLTWPARTLRAHLEFTNLEQSARFRDRPPPRPFYTGLSTRGGYTHRGQVLGAAIGPGSQSQWIALDALDVLGRPVRVGAFAQRIRWNTEALYTAPFFPTYNRFDVSVLTGIRAAARLAWGDVDASLLGGPRYNYQFQNGVAAPGEKRTVDINNVTFTLGVSPRW